MEVLRNFLLSAKALDRFIEELSSSLTLGLLSSLLFLLYSICSYTVLFKFYKKRHKWISALFVISCAISIIGIRYLVEEVIIKAVTGYGNYYEGVSPSYYILDNLYYMVYFFWSLLVFYKLFFI